MNKLKRKEKLEKEKEQFLFSILGIKILRYGGKYETINFSGPVSKKDGTISIFNPISLVVFKRRIIQDWNKIQENENKIKGIPQVKIRVVGSGEEKWL